MLVRGVLRNDSTSSAEHNAYVASLMMGADHRGSDASPPPAKPAGGGGAAAPPRGGSDSSMPPVKRTLSRKRTKFNLGAGPRPRRQHDDLEMARNLEAEIAALVLQILGIERDTEEVRESIASGSAYRGRHGEALGSVEETLVRKELLLREKERQLREEQMMFLRLQVSNSQLKMAPARTPTEEAAVPAVPQKRVSIVMTSACVDDSTGEKAEQRRLSQVQEVIQRRDSSSETSQQDAGSTDAVIVSHKIEEDPRLLARLGSLELPILVSTLLAGFTLLLFDMASTDLARRLAVLAFGLESSASTILCLIAFRGQQLYSRATDINPLTVSFLQRVCPVTVVALLAFSLGVVAFVLAFVLEASEELGASWLAIVALVFCPTLVAGVLFAVSTVQVRRHSVATPGLE